MSLTCMKLLGVLCYRELHLSPFVLGTNQLFRLDNRKHRTIITRRKEINEAIPQIAPTYGWEVFLSYNAEGSGSQTQPCGVAELKR